MKNTDAEEKAYTVRHVQLQFGTTFIVQGLSHLLGPVITFHVKFMLEIS